MSVQSGRGVRAARGQNPSTLGDTPMPSLTRSAGPWAWWTWRAGRSWSRGCDGGWCGGVVVWWGQESGAHVEGQGQAALQLPPATHGARTPEGKGNRPEPGPPNPPQPIPRHLATGRVWAHGVEGGRGARTMWCARGFPGGAAFPPNLFKLLTTHHTKRTHRVAMRVGWKRRPIMVVVGCVVGCAFVWCVCVWRRQAVV